MTGTRIPTLRTKRYTGYQQAIIYTISLSLKRILLLILCIVSFSLFSQNSDSLTFVQYRYANGQISSEGNLRDGQPDGYWKSYFENGVLKAEGDRVNHKLNGPWKFYNEAGQLQSVINYEFGLKNGLRETWRDSTLVSTEMFISDKLEGVSTYFYPDGSTEKIIPFINGREDGRGYHYNSEGTIDALLTYRSGVLTKEQNINRTDRLGLRQGVWMTFHSNMSIKVEGTYKDDLKHGFWKYYQPNGNLIRLERWIMGVLQEGDDETSKNEIRRTINPNTGLLATIGTYQNGQKNGVHQTFDSIGNPLSAELYRRGILLAIGKYDEEGRKQGEWMYFYEDSTLKAIGNYVNDRREDQWKYYFEDGRLEQVGSYIYDDPDGVWRWYFEDGELRKEQTFVDGLADGEFIEYNDSNEVIVTGQYIDGLKTGIWKYTIHNVEESGRYVQDEKQGEWTETWLDINQVRFRGSYQNGEPFGTHTWFFKNGEVQRRGNFSNGLKDGVWEVFAINGARIITVTYDQGVEVKFNRTDVSGDGRF